jgi:dTDP-4-dehydrorhamnose 3,5-epimerase
MKVGAVLGIAAVVMSKQTPNVDERGFFCRITDRKILSVSGINYMAFVHDRISVFPIRTVRGLRICSGCGEVKLGRLWHGEIFEVNIDLSDESLTFRNRRGCLHIGKTRSSLNISVGCVHGFQALTDHREETKVTIPQYPQLAPRASQRNSKCSIPCSADRAPNTPASPGVCTYRPLGRK